MAKDPDADSVGGKNKMAKDGWDGSVTWTDRQIAIQAALVGLPLCQGSIDRLTAELAILNQGEVVVWPKGRPKKVPNT